MATEIWPKEPDRIATIRLSDLDSAANTFSKEQKLIGATLLSSALMLLYYDTFLLLRLIVWSVTLLYFCCFLFKTWINSAATQVANKGITEDELLALDEKKLPFYSILVPLYKEARVLRKLVRNLSQLDYPKDLLEIFLLLEKTDTETQQAVSQIELPPYFKPIVLEEEYPRTKPRACNQGLTHAKGKYIVVYDAEDLPEPDQLKKAVIAFSKAPKNVVCIQAILEYINPYTNLLTRFFAAEYISFYRFFLQGLSRLELPIPLGGTSNHFLRSVLSELGGWDPFNVTEDADLGMRLYRNNYCVQLIESITYEEANSRLGNWIRQRSRWIKGYFQTYFVHMKDPKQLLKDLGLRNFIAFQLIIGGSTATLVLNPLLWLLTIYYTVTRDYYIELLFTSDVYTLGMISMLVGNYALIDFTMTSVMRRGQTSLVLATLCLPIYWVLMSIAAWKAAAQLILKPHYWEKTDHGLIDETLNEARREVLEEQSTRKLDLIHRLAKGSSHIS